MGLRVLKTVRQGTGQADRVRMSPSEVSPPRGPPCACVQTPSPPPRALPTNSCHWELRCVKKVTLSNKMFLQRACSQEDGTELRVRDPGLEPLSSHLGDEALQGSPSQHTTALELSSIPRLPSHAEARGYAGLQPAHPTLLPHSSWPEAQLSGDTGPVAQCGPSM